MKKKIIITGGTGRFGSILKKQKNSYQVLFPDKKKLNILKLKTIRGYLEKNKPHYLVHLAGLSRPMSIHDENIQKSIDLNIIGTANIVKACSEMNIKLVYFSTNYVYPGTKGNYKESDSLFPINNYAWSKLGGECSVQLYKNSLILRVSMKEFPFVHKGAFADAISSFVYQNDVAKILFKILDLRGVLNIGGKKQTVYNFIKKKNKSVKKIFCNSFAHIHIPRDSSLNINKLKNVLKKKND